MDKIIYIHYGNTQFDPSKGFPIQNKHRWPKPDGGLWASRKNASFGWKDWCAAEEFRECDDNDSFDFVMKTGSNVVIINSLAQLQRLPRIEYSWPGRSPLDTLADFSHHDTRDVYYIDFEKCVQMGIDAIELCWYGEEFKNVSNDDLYYPLYGWDCDSIVVLNPDAVIQLRKDDYNDQKTYKIGSEEEI